ncbi:AzlC family ABC transporter permease [Arthrobacter subterraneus]|uniref:AzlC family ABC transporter permease n=1 Tax=Arthrobacter subterraneus TaxID=335973 RepID=UPI0038101AE1
MLGLSFGAAASNAGWGFWAPVVFSMLTFSGSAQFALLTTLALGGAAAAIAAAILINARYVVMGVALNDSLRGNRGWRAVQAQALTDASFVVAHRGDGRFDLARLASATVPQWVCWVGGTALGVSIGPSPELLQNIGADVIFPAFFLMLAMDEVRRSSRALLGSVCAAAIAGGLLFVTEPSYVLLAATAGALAGAIPGRPEKPERGDHQ